MPVERTNDGFKRYVEVGRVAMLTKGANAGSLVVIVDIVNHRTALVDSPLGDKHVERQVVNFNDITLTPITIAKFPRGARTGVVTKKWAAADVDGKWSASAWAQKLAARETRANLSDFERFKLMRAKKQRRFIVDKELAKAGKA